MVSTRRARTLACADSPQENVASLPAPPSTERVQVVATSARRKPGRPSNAAIPPPELTPAPILPIAVPVEIVVADPQVENVPESSSVARLIKPGRPEKRTIIRPKDKSKKGREKVKTDKDAALDQRKGDLTAEPNICERCQLDNTTMDHFFRKHNGLLTEEEKNLSIKEKRKLWSRTVKKKYKLHCQRSECGSPVASSTAMVYHAKTCGVVVEKKPCPYCQKEYSVFTITQHINEHDRSNGEWKRKGKYRDGLEELESEDFASTSQKSELFGPAPHDAIEMSSLKKTKTEKVTQIRESERYQQRHKRQSAIRAGQCFQSSDGEADDSQESVDDDDVDSDGEESDTSEDETKSSTSRGTKNSLKCSSEKRYSTKFTSSANFPRLYAYWKRSLEALGYAKCEMSSCNAVTATLPEMVQHHKTCVRSKTKLPPGVAKHSFEIMRCHQCNYRTHAVRRMVRHYQKSHDMSLEQADEEAENKKLANSSWELTQKEYDDMRLFE